MLIIAVKDYTNIRFKYPDVVDLNSVDDFIKKVKEFMENTLNIPETNLKLLEDPNYDQIKNEI